MRPSSTAPRRHRLAAAGVGLLVVATACSATTTDGPDSTGTGAASDATAAVSTGSTPAGHLSGTTAPPAADAPIVYELEVDATVACAEDGATVTVPIRWASRNATQVAVLVDNAQVPGLQPGSGTATVPVPCDGTSHVVVVTAIAADGRTAVDSRVVQTIVDAAGDQGT